MARIMTRVWVLAVPVLAAVGVCRGEGAPRGLELLSLSEAEAASISATGAEAERVLLEAQSQAIMLEYARSQLRETLALEQMAPAVDGSVSVPAPGVGAVALGAVAFVGRRRRS